MNDRVEVLLQVDPLAQAVCGNQNVGPPFCKGGDSKLAILGIEPAGDGLNLDVLGQPLPELLGHVLRRGDEAAEHDGVAPLLNQALDQLCGSYELAVLVAF